MKFNDIYDSARPYIACFVILRNKEGKIAMLRRKNTGWMDGYYGLPAGKVEYGETYLQASIREVAEEVGVTVSASSLSLAQIVHRHGIEGKGFMDWVDVYFEASDWQGDPYVAEPEKASAFGWIDCEVEGEQIVPAQLNALESISRGERYSEFGWDA
ncbi:MAG TPA: NUDIX domain-containing protein [Candidatus Saccharibacteria bacterium]|nr:NUDIX domain-containing protein [Candidatus Saccharibacteria bacterium]